VNATELREALERLEPNPFPFQVLYDAARTIALPILEADRREVWFCVAHVSSEGSYHIWPTSHGPFTDCVMERSLVIPLAAISTPTPVESE
jgi:hypothetical protein